jgi:hypothetical protein
MFLRPTRRQRCLAGGLALAAILGVLPLLTSAEPAAGRKIEVLVLGNEGEIHATGYALDSGSPYQ